MKIDYPYIESVKADLENNEIDRKEAKQRVFDYAKESFNLDLNKQKSLDNMIVQLEDLIANYKEEPMPDQNNGVSIAELIEATDQLEGKSVFNEAKQEALDLMAPLTVVAGKSEKDTNILDKPAETIVETLNKEPVALVEPEATIVPVVNETITEGFVLPADFVPTITMIGRSPGYYTLPWWIYQWIIENEDWKSKPEKCPEYSAISILKSLIYYINKNGSVKIRETRNSSFVDLT